MPFFYIGNEENSITCFQICKLCDLTLHIIRNELIDRSLVCHIVQNFQISKTSHTDRLSIL